MRTLRLLPLMALLLMSFNNPPAKISDADRKFAVDYLIETRDFVFKTVKGLTNDQLNFKSSPDAWSIAECAEHIAITESGLFGWMEGSLKEPADADKLAEVKMTKEEVAAMITDRSNKFKTNEASTPKNSFGSCDASLKEFKAKRDAHIEYMKTTQDDLHAHVVTLPNGVVFDSYQLIIFMAGHTKRHTLQMAEVMADANFPKKKK